MPDDLSPIIFNSRCSDIHGSVSVRGRHVCKREGGMNDIMITK